MITETPLKSIASYNEWVPGHYLRDYYSVIETDELETIKFFVNRVSQLKDKAPMLFFGVGPTLHHVFLATPKASELHLADYLPLNIEEINKWIYNDVHSHNWETFVKYTLQCEGISEPTKKDVAQREEITRQIIKKLLQVDAGDTDPLGEEYRGFYSVVVSPYCADSATLDKVVWEKYMHNIASLVKPGGIFLTAALRKCRSYIVGDKHFPCANIDEHDMRRVLELDFYPGSINIETKDTLEHESQGYSSILLAYAIKKE